MGSLTYRKPILKYPDAPAGTCRYCGQAITHPADGHWHTDCLHEWRMRADHRYARRHVGAQQAWRCAECDIDCATPHDPTRGPRLELDHRRPLIDGGTHGPENLQGLCSYCHARKTARETRARARRRRRGRQLCLPLDQVPDRPRVTIRETPTIRGER